MTAGFLPFDPDYTYNFQVLVENDSTGSYVPSDDTVKMEFYFDENKDGIYNVGIDRKVGENDITLNFSPGQSHSINGNIQDTAYPDPSRALFAVIDPGTSPNCNCSKEVQISPFIVGLPVELNSFDVVLNNRIANLIWTTASETNNEGWIIQRRINENTGFENIGEVAGAGHSNQNLTYFFDDDLTHVQGRIVYYRLMQQDFDGQVKYSKTKAVYLNNISKKALVYPNPSNGMVAIKIPGNIDPIQYSLVNSVGQVVLEGSANNNEQINVSSLAKGIYFVNIFNTDLDIERISLLIE